MGDSALPGPRFAPSSGGAASSRADSYTKPIRCKPMGATDLSAPWGCHGCGWRVDTLVAQPEDSAPSCLPPCRCVDRCRPVMNQECTTFQQHTARLDGRTAVAGRARRCGCTEGKASRRHLAAAQPLSACTDAKVTSVSFLICESGDRNRRLGAEADRLKRTTTTKTELHWSPSLSVARVLRAQISASH